MSLKIHLAILALVILFGSGLVAAQVMPQFCCGSPIGPSYPDLMMCMMFCLDGCYECDFSEFGYDCQGYYGYHYTCQQDDGDDKRDPKLDVDAESTCDGLLVTVTSGGDPVEDARAIAKVKTPTGAVELLGSGDTDSDGEILFPGLCGDENVNVYASEPGYKASDVLVMDLIPCERCGGQEEGCKDSSVCLSDQRCSDGQCVPVPCECGRVANHECVQYECCSDSSCAAGQVCKDNECTTPEPDEYECRSDADCPAEKYCDATAVGAAGGSCQDVQCGCGEVRDHACVSYECCADADCTQGESCTDNECILYEMSCPTTGTAGEDVTCTVTADGEPCVNCQAEVTGPDGNTFTVMTDENGNFSLPPGEPGNYKVVLPKNGQQLNVQVGAPSAEGGAGDEEPSDGGLFSWLLLLLLLLLLGAGVWYLSSMKKR